MTASDHLKQATGSLGGDQVSSELSNEQLEHIASNPDAALDYAAEACPEDLQQLAGELLAKRVIYESVSAALAQKTRECEHHVANINSLNKSIHDLEAQVEQLGRQVAEMSAEVTHDEIAKVQRSQKYGPDSPTYASMCNAVLASRARTK